MSHHLDSPTAREDGRVDITDIYIFASETPNFTVLVMAVNPLAGEVSPTTFRAGAIYDFKIDTNRDLIEDLDYRITFSEPDAQGTQQIQVQQLVGNTATEFDSHSPPIAQGDTGEIISVAEGGRLWAGLAADPFFFNLGAFGQFAKLILEENRFAPSVFDTAENALAGHNVTAIVLELPNAERCSFGELRPFSMKASGKPSTVLQLPWFSKFSFRMSILRMLTINRCHARMLPNTARRSPHSLRRSLNSQARQPIPRLTGSKWCSFFFPMFSPITRSCPPAMDSLEEMGGHWQMIPRM